MKIGTSKKLFLLIATFIVGFIILIILNRTFISLVNDLDKQTDNYHAQIQIKKYVNEDFISIKSLFFELATTTTMKKSRDSLIVKIQNKIKQIENSIKVLEDGGTLQRLISISKEGYDDFFQKTTYIVNPDVKSKLDIKDIKIKLFEIQNMIGTIDNILFLRTKYRGSKNKEGFNKISKEIRIFYLDISEYFTKINEDVELSLHQNDLELIKLKNTISKRKFKYLIIKLALIFSIILLVSGIGYKISLIINKENKKLEEVNEELETKEFAVKAILDGQSNIVVVSDGTEMITANFAIVEFFNQFKTIDEFMDQHNCICDFFIENPEDKLYITKKEYDGDIWLRYILKNPNKDFKVMMNNGKENRHFSITANKKNIDKEGNFLVIVSLNDITSEVISKQELKHNEKAVKAILDGQTNIIVVSDGRGMITINHTIVDFFDEFDSVNDFMSKHDCICDFFLEVEDDSSYIVKKEYDGDIWLQYILKNQNQNQDFKVLMNDGRENHHFSISANKKIIDDKGNFIVIVSLTDITSEIKSKNELAKLNDNLEHIINDKTKELQELNENLEQKVIVESTKARKKDQQMIEQSRFASLGEMIGNIAHQWRQPLSAISSTASGTQVQIQLGISSDKEIEKAFTDIRGYVTFLNQTIEDFRSFMKQDDNIVEFDMNDVAKKAIGITSAGYKDNNIILEKDFLNFEIISEGSSSKLSQVFLNILNNARDALVENEITDKFVHISSTQTQTENIITIQDNAGGIPSHIINKIFDPYFTTKHQSQGTGIGLYMSKDIIEKHMKGTISVLNKNTTLNGKVYNGACFTVSIPRV
ncbi:MAG: HAMP domain-containing histidine kinase [Arcobacteraceae bacterium]|nr:HAMP domain-containing histidine kinase [Arcobacteraceae bacterium]